MFTEIDIKKTTLIHPKLDVSDCRHMDEAVFHCWPVDLYLIERVGNLTMRFNMFRI